MTWSKCFVCERRVIGLKGQDAFLDTFYLKGEDRDRQVIEAKAFGSCHFVCLMTTQWSSFWAMHISENMQFVRRFPVIAESNDLQILHNDVMNDTVIIERQGWFTSLSDASLKEVMQADGKWLAPIRHELTLDLAGQENLFDLIAESFALTQPYPLFTLIQNLNLDDRLLSPFAVESGSVRSQRVGLGSKAQGAWKTQEVLSVEARYFNFLPQNVYGLLNQVYME